MGDEVRDISILNPPCSFEYLQQTISDYWKKDLVLMVKISGELKLLDEEELKNCFEKSKRKLRVYLQEKKPSSIAPVTSTVTNPSDSPPSNSDSASK